MKKNQRIVLFATAMILIAMLLFPPFKSQYLQGVTVNAGYAFILKPPTYKLYNSAYKSQVNLALLGLQYLIVATVGGILCFIFKKG